MIFFLACLEIFSIALILPLMAVYQNPSFIHSNNLLQQIFSTLHFESQNSFLVFMGVGVSCAVVVSSLAGILAMNLITRFSFQLGRYFSTMLFSYYMKSNYLFHTQNNSAYLINKVSKQVDRITMGLILPFLQINSRLLIVLFMMIGLVIVNPYLILTTAIVLLTVYFFIFAMTRKILERNGSLISRSSNTLLKTLNEAFGGVKEVKFLGKESVYVDQYDQAANDYAQAATTSQVIPVVPRYLLDAIAFTGIISIILYYLLNGQDLNNLLPLLTLFVITGLKVLPALQQIFANLSNIKTNMDALNIIEADLIKSFQSQILENPLRTELTTNPLSPQQEITLQNISFSYPGKSTPVFKDFSLQIKAKSSIAIIGKSGSGKTTLADILLGLLKIDSGKILVDSRTIDFNNLRQWQSQIGYVSQNVYLSDTSVLENIALGTPKNEIDMNKVKRAAQMAELDSLIESLDKKYEAPVGERGVQLSGGQKQRIGIARALYYGASVLLLDEATSALDGTTESNINQSIQSLMGKMTVIIIAHRLSTVQNCDRLVLLENGKIKADGSYNELLINSSDFQQLANINKSN